MKAKHKRKDNNFSQETRDLFIYNYRCWKCGMNTWDCLHHILSGEYSDSPLNAAPLCNAKCHIGGGHYFTEEETRGFLADTLEYLLLHQYTLTNRDKCFISANLAKYKASKLGLQLINSLNILD